MNLTLPAESSELTQTEAEIKMEKSFIKDYPTWGTCFPSTCSKSEVSDMLAAFLKELTNGSESGVVLSCYSAKAKSLDALDVTMM